MTFYNKIQVFVKSPAFRSAGIYTFSHFIVKAIAFLLLFVYSNPFYISVEENGLLNLMSSAVFLLMPFLSMGTIQSTSVDFFKLSAPDFKDFFTTGFIIPIAVMLAGMLAMYFFRNQLGAGYGFPVSFVFIIPFMTFLAFCNEQFVSLIRNNDEPGRYFRASMLRVFIEVSLSVTLVVSFAWRWQGRVAGILAANTVLLGMAFIYFKKRGYLFGKIKKMYLRQELAYAFPIIIMQCSIFCLSSSDKFFLSSFANNNVVGVYGYACVFAAVVTIACSAVINYVMPKIYGCLSCPVVNFSQVKKYFHFYAAFCLAALAAVVIFTPVLYKYFINNRYYPGLKYMYLIATGYFFWSISYFFYSFLLFHKQKKKIFILSVSGILVSLVSNYFFIKNFQEMGAAVSVCVSYFIVLVITLLFSYKNVCAIFIPHKVESPLSKLVN